jgi:hypothetical protein
LDDYSTLAGGAETMIRRFTTLIVGVALSHVAFAQHDPCVTIGGKLTIYTTDIICEGGNIGLVRRDQIDAILASQAVVELRSLVAEIRGLRQEMKTHAESLVQARAKFDSSSKDVATAQEKWRKEALTQTLADIAAVPSRLGANEALRAAMLSALKEELPKDPAFLEALQTAVKK